MIKSFFIAISIYSKIPVPQFPWKKEDMKYIFCFFPWIGALIGGCIYFWNDLCDIYGIGILCRTAIDIGIPIVFTGGFHIDGFVDTMDALHSYQTKEKKLEILKDSHIGAFALIEFAVYGLFLFAAFSEIKNKELLKIVCSSFFLSRCLCGISIIFFPLAKKEGILFLFASNAYKKVVSCFLCLQTIVCIAFMCFWSFFAIPIVISAVLVLLYYFYQSKKEFGGISGDTSGYFVLLCEGYMIVVTAFISIFIGG